VTGNLIISGSRNWEGVLLVGGSIRSNGNNTTRGGHSRAERQTGPGPCPCPT
jgi:hypothetical protein